LTEACLVVDAAGATHRPPSRGWQQRRAAIARGAEAHAAPCGIPRRCRAIAFVEHYRLAVFHSRRRVHLCCE
jgi:hypothetical protein